MRRLIINADDFGLTVGVNRAIVEAHSKGLVTSTTLMSNAAAVNDAVDRARAAPQLGVGCHVVLVDGVPLLPAKDVSSLLAEDGVRFRDGWPSFAASALRGHLQPDQIAAEVEAQIRSIQAAGLHVTHVDSHKHVHLLPEVLRPMLRAARACGVRAVRNPFEPRKALSSGILAKHPELWTRHLEVTLLRRKFAREFRRIVADAGMVTTDGTVGIVVTGALDHGMFAAIIQALPEGMSELACHPGYSDRDLAGVRTRLRQSRAEELAVLTSAGARRVVEACGIELISYADL